MELSKIIFPRQPILFHSRKSFKKSINLHPDVFAKLRPKPASPQESPSKANHASCINYYRNEQSGRYKYFPDISQLLKDCEIVTREKSSLNKFVGYLEALYKDKHELFNIPPTPSKERKEKVNLINRILMQIHYLGQIKNFEERFANPHQLEQIVRECLWIVEPDLALHHLVPLTDSDTKEIIEARYKSCTSAEACFADNSIEKRVLKDFLSGTKDKYKEQACPTLFLVTGAPGFGKSTLIKKLEKEQQALKISPDDFKAKIAEFNKEEDGKEVGACNSHEASISIAARSLEQLPSFNFILETSGTSPDWLRKVVQICRSKGYKIVYEGITLLPLKEKEAVKIVEQRIVQRYHKDLAQKGFVRFADPRWGHTGYKNLRILLQLWELFDTVNIRSNNVPKGRQATLVGSFKRKDLAKFERLLAKSF